MKKNQIMKAAGIAAVVVGAAAFLYKRYRISCDQKSEAMNQPYPEDNAGIRHVMNKAKMAGG